MPHPVALAGRAIALLDRELNRRSAASAARRDRGIVTVVLLVAAAAALGWALQRLCRGSLIGALVEALAIGVLLAQRSLFDHVAAVARALRRGRARRRPRRGRAISSAAIPTRLDEHGVARAAIE